MAGEEARCIGIQNGKMVSHDIIDCLENMKRPFRKDLYDLSNTLF